MGGRGSLAARWGRLFLGLVCVWAFMFVIAPGLRRIPPVEAVLDCVRDRSIDATALFYTESAEFAVAEVEVRESLSRD